MGLSAAGGRSGELKLAELMLDRAMADMPRVMPEGGPWCCRAWGVGGVRGGASACVAVAERCTGDGGCGGFAPAAAVLKGEAALAGAHGTLPLLPPQLPLQPPLLPCWCSSPATAARAAAAVGFAVPGGDARHAPARPPKLPLRDSERGGGMGGGRARCGPWPDADGNLNKPWCSTAPPASPPPPPPADW